jgi:hypothetical protein
MGWANVRLWGVCGTMGDCGGYGVVTGSCSMCDCEIVEFGGEMIGGARGGCEIVEFGGEMGGGVRGGVRGG